MTTPIPVVITIDKTTNTLVVTGPKGTATRDLGKLRTGAYGSPRQLVDVLSVDVGGDVALLDLLKVMHA